MTRWALHLVVAEEATDAAVPLVGADRAVFAIIGRAHVVALLPNLGRTADEQDK